MKGFLAVVVKWTWWMGLVGTLSWAMSLFGLGWGWRGIGDGNVAGGSMEGFLSWKWYRCEELQIIIAHPEYKECKFEV
jgi:hypothetical protein